MTREQKYELKNRVTEERLIKNCCGNRSLPGVQVNVTSNGKYSGFSDSRQILYFRLANCKHQQNQEAIADAILTLTCQNPTSHQDFRWYGVLSAKLFTISALSVIIALWIINWILHFRVQIGIHYLITTMFASVLIMTIVRYLELRALDKEHTAPVLTPIRVVLVISSASAFCITFLMATKGWCIIRDEISCAEFFRSCFASFFFITLGAIAFYLEPGTIQIIVVFVAVLFVALFVRELFTSVNDASLHVMAHLLAISNAGIDPETTPVYKKHMMYQRLHLGIIVGCVFMLLKAAMIIANAFNFWLDELITDLIMVAGAAGFAVIFRLREIEVFGYGVIEESERGEFSLADVEKAGGLGRVSDFGGAGRKWDSGMPLPLMPNLVGEKGEVDEERVVIVAGPEGTETVSGRVVNEVV
jgi:hypothetical protein